MFFLSDLESISSNGPNHVKFTEPPQTEKQKSIPSTISKAPSQPKGKPDALFGTVSGGKNPNPKLTVETNSPLGKTKSVTFICLFTHLLIFFISHKIDS